MSQNPIPSADPHPEFPFSVPFVVRLWVRLADEGAHPSLTLRALKEAPLSEPGAGATGRPHMRAPISWHEKRQTPEPEGDEV